MVYRYKHGFSGFAARLTQAQAKMVAGILYHTALPTYHFQSHAYVTPQFVRLLDAYLLPDPRVSTMYHFKSPERQIEMHFLNSKHQSYLLKYIQPAYI